MKILSATFSKGITDSNQIVTDGLPHVAFIGRSNVGKSSVINSFTRQKGLARTSSFPGRTQQLNFFLINKSFYLVDLPGYGYADISEEGRERLQHMIDQYLFNSPYEHKKIVFIIDAEVGFTAHDFEMLHALEEQKKDFVILANKIDKIKKTDYKKKTEILTELAGSHQIIWYSAEKNIGVGTLTSTILTAVGSKPQKRKIAIFGGPSVQRGVNRRARTPRM